MASDIDIGSFPAPWGWTIVSFQDAQSPPGDKLSPPSKTSPESLNAGISSDRTGITATAISGKLTHIESNMVSRFLMPDGKQTQVLDNSRSGNFPKIKALVRAYARSTWRGR
jgi:hypothetical protein